MKRAWFLALTLMPVQAMAETKDVIRFVSCPIYRDTNTGRKSGCWLADENVGGIRYDVTNSPSKPDWNHEILVEGKVSALQDGLCGGVTLDPVRVSILDGWCPRHMIPGEGYTGRKFALPLRNVRPLSEERKVPPPPYADKSFFLYFEHDRSFFVYQYDDYLFDQAVTWMRAAKPKKIIITGYAATRPETVSGRSISERAEVAKERAEVTALSLQRLGFGKDMLEVRWESGSEPIDQADADGLPDQSRRRVEIRAVMGD